MEVIVLTEYELDKIYGIYNDIEFPISILQNLKYVFMNKKALELIQIDSIDKLRGISPLDISPVTQPDGRSSTEAANDYINRANNGETVSFKWVQKNGRGKFVTYSVTIKQFEYIEDGIIIFWIDISTYQEQKEWFEIIMSTFPGEVYIKDEQLNYAFYHGENIKIKEKLKKNNENITSRDFFSEKESKFIDRMDTKLLNEMGTTTYDFSYNLDNETRWIKDMKSTFYNNAGEKFLFGITTDVTDLKQAIIKIEQLKQSLLNSLKIVTELRDPYTVGHEDRVSKIAVEIATVMGLDEEEIEDVRIGALIHDIGKINIPLEILNKPGKLTELEYEFIKQHTIIGESIVQTAKFNSNIVGIVKHHHEKIDGSGYPDGLIGEKIPFFARIVCVADSFEAMLSHRPYRPKKDIDYILNELIKNKGIFYDATIVDELLKVYKKFI
jgi:putative nucleotidyltransferase with HDIG domain